VPLASVVTTSEEEAEMSRKTGIAISAAVSLVLMALGLAVGANVGAHGSKQAEVGSKDAQPRVVTVEVTETPKAEAAMSDGSEPPVQIVDVPIPSEERAAASLSTGSSDDDRFEHENEPAEAEHTETEHPEDGVDD
jgi:hypothetical protein